MKKEKIIETLKLMPTYSKQIGYFFKATQHGIGLVEEAKKIAKEVWKQEFCVIFTNQIDAIDLMSLCEYHKDKEVTYIFSDIEKANPKLRDTIFRRFSTNRSEFLNDKSHVIYLVNPDDNECYQDPWDDYVMTHSIKFNVES